MTIKMIYKCIDCGRTGFEKSVCVFVYVLHSLEYFELHNVYLPI